MRQNLGPLTDLEAVTRLIDLDGKHVLDIGCGPGDIARSLAEAGATVIGLEPDPAQAAKNAAAAPTPGVTLLQAPAEALPVAPASQDAVFFFRSLHHVPIDAMDKALHEAARVLKPGGSLFVLEPGMDGSHFAVMRPYHDETIVRTEAQAALARTASRLFESASHHQYHLTARYPDFEAMVTRVTGQTFNNIQRADVETPHVRALFEQGRTPDNDYAFDQPMLLDLYQRPKPALA
ncbi:MAG: class I SAM-dependent methyltransferase [Polymorphobacter sp.]|uniref:class I SAM-dependent methyltransferase n=1 Tax=Polymorphobacter sp. TaxID=1909290 RepID=UPI003A8A64BD